MKEFKMIMIFGILCFMAGSLITLTPVLQSVEAGSPAIVNPTGWNKVEVCKHLDSIIKECDKPDVTVPSLTKEVAKHVCDIPSSIIMKFETKLDKYSRLPPKDVAANLKLDCVLYKQGLGGK